MKNLQDTVAIVTGAGRGIGRQIAMEQALRGAKVCLISRTRSEIDQVAAEIVAQGGTALALTLDVTDGEAAQQVIAEASAALGPIDLLVNNHGSFQAFGPIWECDPQDWWEDVEINLRGTFHTCRAVAPSMLERGRGRIVNLVGGGTGNSFPHGSGYASSKAGIMRFTECLNDTTKASGALAFAVDPGLVRTKLTELQLNSPSGKTFLPEIETMFAKGVDVSPTLAAGLIAAIASGRFDKLAGRMLQAVDDLDRLEADMAAIVAQDLRSLRITGQ